MTRPKTTEKSPWALAAAFSSAYVFVDLCRTYQLDDWQFGNASQWVGVALGFLLVTVTLWLVGRLISTVLFRGRALHWAITLVAALLPLGLGRLAGIQTSFCLAGAAAVLVFGVWLRWLCRRNRPVAGRTLSAFLFGIALLCVVTQLVLFNTNRAHWAIGIASGGVVLLLLISAKRLRIGAVALIVVLWGTVGWMNHRPAQQDRPNLVLVVSDAMRANYLELYGGHVPVPGLTALANDGALFERPYSTAPWTLPSMFSLFSSTYPPAFPDDASEEELARLTASLVLDADVSTLAERLTAEGYTTGAFVANVLLDDTSGILQGFQFARWKARHWPRRDMRLGLWARLPLLHEMLWHILPDRVPQRRIDETALLTRYAKAFMRRNAYRPTFLWVHYMDPHDPYAPPPVWLQGLPERPDFTPSPEIHWPEDEASRNRMQAQHAEYARLYGGEIRYVDSQVGELRDTLQALGTYQNTFICFTADHGEEFWEHKHGGHGRSLYQALVQVPLIITGPGIAPRRIRPNVSSINVTPTLATCVGLTPDEHWVGHNLAPLLMGMVDTVDSAPCLAQALMPPATQHQMVVQDQLKLIRESNAHENSVLYDVVADPLERTDLTEDKPGDTVALHGIIDQHLDHTGKTSSSTLSDEEIDDRLESLRSIGYID